MGSVFLFLVRKSLARYLSRATVKASSLAVLALLSLRAVEAGNFRQQSMPTVSKGGVEHADRLAKRECGKKDEFNAIKVHKYQLSICTAICFGDPIYGAGVASGSHLFVKAEVTVGIIEGTTLLYASWAPKLQESFSANKYCWELSPAEGRGRMSSLRKSMKE